MKLSDLKIDPASIGARPLLVEVLPSYAYSEGKRTNNITGYRYVITMPDHSFDKGYLATLARQGRAMGIHLLLATQRPDVKVMDGQIKNNIDCRICGRADLILSQIILDNGSAAEIPKDVPGRFICNLDGGIEFQGYAISDFGGGRA